MSWRKNKQHVVDAYGHERRALEAGAVEPGNPIGAPEPEPVNDNEYRLEQPAPGNGKPRIVN